MRILASIFPLAFLAFSACGETVLTNASDVLALPGDQALGRNVHLRGVVTAAQPSSKLQPNWDGGFFIQDGTAGIYAVDASRNSPKPGDLVEVTGTSHPGGFAPYIAEAHWTKVGTAPLPEASAVPIEQLMAGIEDGQRVEISGIVRSFTEDPPILFTEVASGGYRVKVYSPPLPGVDPKALIGAKVRVRGTASTFYSADLRQLISVELHVPSTNDFAVEKKQAADPFAAPVEPLNRLGQYRRDRELGERVHVRGTVTFQRPGLDLFVQDSSTGIQIKSPEAVSVKPGDVVEAVGFLEFENFLPVLDDALFRKIEAPPQTVKAIFTPISALRAGFRHSQLIRLEGKVLDYAERQIGDSSTGNGRQRSILTLQNAGTLFTVEGFSAGPNRALARV
ncbi:MAG TPA: hypothetical protein VK327_01110, partial [Candidatus Paceibacterota bacterium]|nr:hypothetical protein [Candidatus Paceibacterota bacterium]